MVHDQIIVVDTNKPFYRQNKIFAHFHTVEFFEAIAMLDLLAIANQSGWQMMTGDIFLSSKRSFHRAVCLSNEATPELAQILRRGAEPSLLVCGESPNVVWDFYHNIPHLSKGFRHVCLFRGVAGRVNSTARFHTYYWPMPPVSIEKNMSFQDRSLLVMISSFKERFTVNRRRLASRIIRPLRWAKIKWYQAIDSYARFPDLYERRLEAVCTYASKNEFYLYGRFWDVAIDFTKRLRDLHFANRPAECSNKIQTLGKFRFNLALENCIFPGYLTEKIFDAMLAGTVPIYLGAPDIEDFVPKECFVDFRDYNDFKELWKDIAAWDEKRWLQKIDAIKAFVSSSRFDPFRQEKVAENYFKWLTDEN